jgi:hypothetical protein
MANPVQETRFDYKGFPCVVLFMPVGYRCGYIGIPKGHMYYRKPHCDIYVDCHCGLSYSGTYLNTQIDSDISWWIGFDCGHCCDGYDFETAKKLYAEDNQIMESISLLEQTRYYQICNKDKSIRTLDYCIDQCKHIVDQIDSEVK